MLVQRISQQALRRAAFQQPAAFSRIALHKIAAPTSIATSHHQVQSRQAATQALKQDDAYQILAKQRLNRPVSPHLAIYRPQVTWYLSILNRITGSVLSGGFYIFGFSYLVASLFGWHLESGSMVAAFGSLPLLAKVGLKFSVALPFTFHSFNGIRHLVWDTGRELSNKAVQNTGWAVVGISVASAGILAYL
ncbi:hypothetical protein MMC32_007002 [Xylographa parallela]|nr:hypothetical protein [Xylographa parallela]